MHADEIEIDVSLASRLIAGQFPHWAGLPIEQVHSAGTDNAIFRLGGAMAIRLPRRPGADGQVKKEHQWLPRLAPLLPLAAPVPIEMGMPAEGYPYHWSVCHWLNGENALTEPIVDLRRAAIELSQFIAALQQIDTSGGPQPGPHNSFRGVPLVTRDAQTRAAISSLDGIIDRVSATRAWERSLSAPLWNGPPVWIHGDLHPGNLLVEEGRISAVIDFGCLGVGDPACELMVAWTLLSAETRDILRTALSIDAAAWERGRGWALSFGLIALPYYLKTNPTLVEISQRTINEVLADHANGSQ